MVQYPLVRNLKRALLWPAAYALLLWLASYMPPLFVAVCFLSPVFLALCGLSSGLASMAACALIAPAASWLITGGTLFPMLCALYLWPFVLLHTFCFARKIPFWHAAAAHVALLAVSQTAVLMILRPLLGGDLFSGGAEFLVQAISASPYCDSILVQLYQSGLLSVPQDMLTGAKAPLEALFAFLMPGTLMPSVRTELLNGLRTVLTDSLYTLLPSLVINNAVLAGVFGVAFPIVSARRNKIPAMEMAPFSTWHLNPGNGIKVLTLSVVSMVLPPLIQNPGISLAGSMMWAASSAVFMIQGAALMDFIQLRSGGRTFMRRLWPCIIFLLMPTLLVILGVADQFMNIRGLRKPKDREEG